MPSSTTTSTHTAQQPSPRISALESTYYAFYPSTIERADEAAAGAGRLMRDLNNIHDTVAGLGAVLRIVIGNQVLEDEFDPENPAGQPPLSKATESVLVAMAANLCERMRDDIEQRANSYNNGEQS